MTNDSVSHDGNDRNVFADIDAAAACMGQLRTMRIIATALIAGAAIFLGVVTLIRSGQAPADTPMITYIATGFAAVILVMRTILMKVIPRNLISQQREHITDSTAGRKQIAQVYLTRMILGMAMCEGAAFFAIVAWMAESHELALGIVLFLIMVMVMSFPFQQRVLNWIEVQLFQLHPEQ